MSDDLVKRYSSYNIMMLGDSGNEVSTPDGEWVKYKDYYAQADRIEELEDHCKRLRLEAAHANDTADVAISRVRILEAKLAKAIDFVAEVGGGFKFSESLVDWANLHVLKARTLLAELTGGKDE